MRVKDEPESHQPNTSGAIKGLPGSKGIRQQAMLSKTFLQKTTNILNKRARMAQELLDKEEKARNVKKHNTRSKKSKHN